MMPSVFEDMSQGEQSVFSDMEKPSLWSQTKKAFEPYVGMGEAILEQVGGIGSFFNPAPGIAGIVRGIQTGSLEEATNEIRRQQEEFGYTPKTESGKAISGGINQYIFEPIDTMAKWLGNKGMEGVLARGGNPEEAAIWGTLGEEGLKLFLMKKLFETPGKFKALRDAGKLTPEVIKTEIKKVLPEEWKLSEEDIALGKERIVGLGKTEEILSREPVRGKVSVFEDMKTEEPPITKTSRLYSEMGGREQGIAGIYDTLVKKGFALERRIEIMNRLYPDIDWRSDIIKSQKLERPTMIEQPVQEEMGLGEIRTEEKYGMPEPIREPSQIITPFKTEVVLYGKKGEPLVIRNYFEDGKIEDKIIPEKPPIIPATEPISVFEDMKKEPKEKVPDIGEGKQPWEMTKKEYNAALSSMPPNDKVYLDAINNGEFRKAQRMVDKISGLSMPKTPMSDKQISEIVQTIDTATPRNDSTRKYLRNEYAKELKQRGIEFIDAYHISDINPEIFKKEGIRGSESDYIGRKSGNLRESSVYLFLDPDDIPSGYNGIIGAKNDISNIIHIQIPVSQIENMLWDSNFNVSFGTYSSVRMIGDIPAKWIKGQYKYAPPFILDRNKNIIPLSKRFPSRSPEAGEHKNIVQQEKEATLYSNPLQLFPEEYKRMVDWIGSKIKDTKIGNRVLGQYNSILEFFNPGMTLPKSKEWFYARQESQGGIAIGEHIAKKFIEQYDYLKPEDRAEIWRFMNGNIPIDTLPENLRRAGEDFRKIDNILGNQLVDAGIISEETRLANEGKHIRYIYNKWMTGEGLASGGAKLNTKSFSARKDMTDIERERQGLVHDPVLAIAQSIIEVNKAVSMKRYFRTISQQPEWIFEPSIVEVEGQKMGIGKAIETVNKINEVAKEHPEWVNAEQLRYKDMLDIAIKDAQKKMGEPPKDFVQLNGKSYGDLNGAYVNRTIANDLKPVFEMMGKFDIDALQKLKDLVNTGTALWKLKSVAWNPPTASRNVISNIIQMNMSGIPIHEIFLWLIKAIKSYMAENIDYMNFLKQGGFKGNFSTGELNELLGIVSHEGGLGNILNMAQKLGKYYGKIDDIFKFAKYLEGIDKGLPIPEAARLGIKWGMDYSLVHPGVRWLRSTPFGSPFITYQYKIMPLVLESLRDRPWVVGKYMALPAIIQKFVTKDMTDDDAKKYINSLPDYVKNGQVLLIPGIHGMNALDISYMVPWGNWWQIGMELGHGKFNQAMKETGISGAILPTILYAVRTGKDLFTDEDVISPLNRGNPKEIAWDLTKYIWQTSMPPMLGGYGAAGRIKEHIQHGQTAKGLPTEGMNVYPRTIGVNIYPVDPKAQLMQKRFEIKEVRNALYRKMRDKNLSSEEKQQILEIYQFAVKRIREENE